MPRRGWRRKMWGFLKRFIYGPEPVKRQRSTYRERLRQYHIDMSKYENELAKAKEYNKHFRPKGTPNKRYPLIPTPPLMYPEDF